MITKFVCKETHNSIEFQREVNTLLISIEEPEIDTNCLDVTLTEENLFSLIGQLLRIQSEMKNEGNHGR